MCLSLWILLYLSLGLNAALWSVPAHMRRPLGMWAVVVLWLPALIINVTTDVFCWFRDKLLGGV